LNPLRTRSGRRLPLPLRSILGSFLGCRKRKIKGRGRSAIEKKKESIKERRNVREERVDLIIERTFLPLCLKLVKLSSDFGETEKTNDAYQYGDLVRDGKKGGVELTG